MIVVGIILGLFVATVVWYAMEFIRTHAAVEQWAAANGVRLVELKVELSLDPARASDEKGSIIYRVVVKDAAGELRSGLLRRKGRKFAIWFNDEWVADTQPQGFPVIVDKSKVNQANG